MLEWIVGRLIKRALGSRPAPMLLGFALQPAGWASAYHIPLRPPTQNTPAAIAAALERMMAEYEDVCLWDGTCRTKVCAVWAPGQLTTASAATADDDGPNGACANDVHHASAEATGVRQCQSWVPVVNPGDTHCLARAIVLGLKNRWFQQQRRPNGHFRLWAEAQRGGAGAAAALQLMTRAGITPNRPHYGVRDAQRVQRWLDERLGAQQVRLVLLDRERSFQVAWKAPQPAHFTLTLVCANRHWSYIQQPQQLFHCNKWCPDCERRVERRTHPAGCSACCPACYRFGVGFPCQRQAGMPSRRCDRCNMLFVNDDCFAAHRRQVDPPPPGWEHDRRRGRPHLSLCQERRSCVHCGAIVWPDRQRAPHRCHPNQHQQHVNTGVANAPAMLPPPPVAGAQPPQPCSKCGGAHDVELPCFVQPQRFPQQVEWVDGPQAAAEGDDDAAEVGVLDLLGGRPMENEEEDDDDDDEADGREPADDDDVGRQQQQQTQGGRKKKKRKQIRLALWDVESELVDEANGGEEEEDGDDDDNGQQQQQRSTHRPLLVCVDVICERCIAAGVDLEREPLRRAVGCFCGGAIGAEQRARWCFPVDPLVLADGAQMPEDGRNPRRLAFHQFGQGDAAVGAAQQQPNSTAIAQFVDFLLHHGPRRGVRTIALSHNGGRYDMHFFLEELYRRGMVPTRMVSHGLRLYQLRMGGFNQRDIVLKDSLNFFAAPLGALPAAYGLEGVQDKPFFPYAYIRTANLHTQLDGLPPMAMYEPEKMKPLQRARFMQWYAAEQDNPRPFVLAEQLLEYCGNDVRILRHAVIRYRQLIGAHAGGMEPFQAGSTIAGLALSVYRQCHLPANLVAHSPEGGYRRGRRASMESRRFFWVLERLWSEREGRPVHIQTAEWSIGEAHVEDSGYRLDGLFYRPPPLRPLAIEFNGCFYHGCRQCYPDRDMLLAGKRTADHLHAQTERRSWELEHQHGYQVQQVWECEWKTRMGRDGRLRALAARAMEELPGPLDLRKHALYGGRVEPYQLIRDADLALEEIVALDIVSLYPFVMKYRAFPLGHPEGLTRESLVVEAAAVEQQRCPPLPWSQVEQNPFRGFLLCRVCPPRAQQLGARKPVLPMRTSGGRDQRLVFSLCRMCANSGTPLLPACSHTEHQRSWVAAYTHFELNKALEVGYRVLDLYEVWHYTEWSATEVDDGGQGLFRAYINEWVRLKAEASGWPAGCDSEKQRAAYVEEWEQREGIRLDPARIRFNPGLRALAKLMLNSLWGKLCQRPEQEEVHYTNTARQFHDLLANAKLDVVDFTHINEALDRVQTRLRPPFAKAPPTNALQIACCVTAHARLHLWDYMERIRLAGGEVLYCDTDSAIHVRRRGGPPCVAEGEWLGQMKREMADRRILSVCIAGPKNYAVLHDDGRGGDQRANLKVRSIELTHEASQMLTYRRMRRLIQRHFGGTPGSVAQRIGRQSHILVPQRQFIRTRRAQIRTRITQKIYKPVYTKGIVRPVGGDEGGDGYRTVPFGWREEGDVPMAEEAEEDFNEVDADDDFFAVVDEEEEEEEEEEMELEPTPGTSTQSQATRYANYFSR